MFRNCSGFASPRNGAPNRGTRGLRSPSHHMRGEEGRMKVATILGVFAVAAAMVALLIAAPA